MGDGQGLRFNVETLLKQFVLTPLSGGVETFQQHSQEVLKHPFQHHSQEVLKHLFWCFNSVSTPVFLPVLHSKANETACKVPFLSLSAVP